MQDAETPSPTTNESASRPAVSASRTALNRRRRARTWGDWFSDALGRLLVPLGLSGRRTRKASDSRPSWIFRLLEIVFYIPRLIIFRLVGGFATRFMRWAENGIRWQFLIQGLPALIVALGIMALTIVAQFERAEKLVKRYRDAADDAFNNKRYIEAKTYYSRLEQMDLASDESRFRKVIALLELKENEEAMAILSELAPDKTVRYREAHLLKARLLISQAEEISRMFLRDPASATTANRLLAIRLQYDSLKQLQMLRESDPKDLAATQLLVEIYLRSGQLQKALPLLPLVLHLDPRYRLVMAEVYLGQGKRELAFNELTAGREKLEAKIQDNPTNLDLRMELANFLVRLENFPAAIAAMEEAEAVQANPPPEVLTRIRIAKSNVYAAWAATLANRGQGGLAVWIQLIQQSLKFNPQNQGAMNLLLQFANGTKGDPKAMQTELQKLVATGQGGPLAFTLLGVNAFTLGDTAKAINYLEQGLRMDPNQVDNLNNLAFMLTRTKPPQLDRAMELINRALEKRQHPQFFDTRAQIQLGKENWQAALDDFRQSNDRGYRTANQLRLMAICYDKLGMAELAASHRAQAKTLDANATGTGTAANPAPTAPSQPAVAPTVPKAKT